jgi:putative ABC transport system substrate-binding protein
MRPRANVSDNCQNWKINFRRTPPLSKDWFHCHMTFLSNHILIIRLMSCLAMIVAGTGVTHGSGHRIGVLSPFINQENLFFDTLRQELNRLGYIDGRNVSYVYRNSEQFDGLTSHAAELVRLNVDMIVTEGPQGVRAAKNATSTIPIVFANIGDAVDQGFAATLARPGGNLTGISSLNAELSAKRLELLKETIPGLMRVAIMREAVGDAGPLRAIETSAQAMGLKLLILQVRDGDEVPSAFSAMTASRVGGLELLPGSLFVSRMRKITELAAQSKLPGVFPDARFVRNGGLMSYGPNVVDLYRRAAAYIDKILKGTRSRDLPVEQPTSFEFTVNLKTAKALRVTIPAAVLMRANQVIQNDGSN